MVQVFQARDANAPALCNDSDAIDCLTFTPARTLATCIETGGALRDNGETCVWTDKLQINLASIGYSGWQQFRFRAFVREPDTKEMRVWTGLHANVENGKPLKHVYEDPNVVEGRGWYTGANYANASIKSPPLTPVSGIWQPYVEMEKGAGGLTLTDHLAALDTDFHHGDRGVVVREGSGEFRGNLTIDTTGLTNGWHRLLLKANAFDSQAGSTNSGVLVIYFEVRNG
jgi:hypothetical protein